MTNTEVREVLPTAPISPDEIRVAIATAVASVRGNIENPDCPFETWTEDYRGAWIGGSLPYADAALAALKEAGIDLQELQAKATALDEWLETERNYMLSRYDTICEVLDKHRARLVTEQGEK